MLGEYVLKNDSFRRIFMPVTLRRWWLVSMIDYILQHFLEFQRDRAAFMWLYFVLNTAKVFHVFGLAVMLGIQFFYDPPSYSLVPRNISPMTTWFGAIN